MKSVSADRFGGINLVDDPQEVGIARATDMLNVDLNQPGRIRTRDGYDNFTTAALSSRPRDLFPFYKPDGTVQLVATHPSPGALSNHVWAINSTGGSVANYTPGFADGDFWRAVQFGTPTTDYLYIASRNRPDDGDPDSDPEGPRDIMRWDGAAYTNPAGLVGIQARYLAVQSPDNRLVAAGFAGVKGEADSKVSFSASGDAETFTGTDSGFELITPGDGEPVTALASWGNLIFAFKETKFAVFHGNTLNSDGSPRFNYRLMNFGIGAPMVVASGRPGVFLLTHRGVYLTTGGEPRLISRALDPLFLGDVPATYSGSAINHTSISSSAALSVANVTAAMTWMGERLYVAVATGSSTFNDRLLVWDSITDSWMIWDIPVAGMTPVRIGGEERLYFTYATGSNHIGKLDADFTDDDGTAIASSYQSGIYPLGQPGNDVYTRYTRLWGSGAPTVSVFTNMGSTDANAAAVTLGTAPAVAEGYHQKSYKGRLFSHKFSAASGAWSVSRMQHDLAWERPT